MSLLLTTSRQLPATTSYHVWGAVGAPPVALDAGKKVPGLAGMLEDAFDAAAAEWWELARIMNADASATLAHTPAANANVSDFGLMLAWAGLAEKWLAGGDSVLLVCDDPWLFRHLVGAFSGHAGFNAAAPPGLKRREAALWLRGMAARTRVMLSVIAAWAIALPNRFRCPKGRAAILVYGHPDSRADGREDGYDAYFGPLMREVPELIRILHVDCGPGRVRQLAGPKTFSLHAWGNPLAALLLPFIRWRPGWRPSCGTHNWLVRRAAALEGGGGQAAMIRWQQICQAAWLKSARPSVVAWPWENHSWERALVGAARRLSVRTIGYAHVPVYWREWNYSPATNIDGLAGLPDSVACLGPAAEKPLRNLGLPDDRLAAGGGLRFSAMAKLTHDPKGPVFAALPGARIIADEMMAAIEPLAKAGINFIVRCHPLTPLAFTETTTLRRASKPLRRAGPVAAVLYASTTVGLEALAGGLPVVRFLPSRMIGQGMPKGIVTSPHAADADQLAAALEAPSPSAGFAESDLFDPPDLNVWRQWLAAESKMNEAPGFFAAFRRKAGRILGDPVLRRWTVGRLLRLRPIQPPFAARPPYLAGLSVTAKTPSGDFRERPPPPPSPPTGPVALPLAGKMVTVEPGGAEALFERPFADRESFLALHRFAWLPLMGGDIDPAWVQDIWRVWRGRYGEPGGGGGGSDWPWHPYTAAERAVNIIDFARRFGLPGPGDDTIAVLAAHGPAIFANLEYFGDHNTSNHLANNGRGLYRLGLELGLEDCIEAGRRILLEEAKRIFLPSGVLREGSSHYHLLLARQYADCWLAARRHKRPEAADLEKITAKALAILPLITLPGAMPLIGDVSPDCPPEHLAGLMAGGDTNGGWSGLLDPGDRDALIALRDSAPPTDKNVLAADGWRRADFGPWRGLWYSSPGGWPAMPGHGHQDCGSFELHYADIPLFIDPGRGSYREQAESDYYVSAMAHNGLTIDGQNPYPANKPYYSAPFRRSVCGPAAEIVRGEDTLSLSHSGFSRFKNLGPAARSWKFGKSRLVIEDRVRGAGRHCVTRRLVTTLAARTENGSVIIDAGERTFRLVPGGEVNLTPATYWPAYGVGRAVTVIEIRVEAAFPWAATMTIEVDS